MQKRKTEIKMPLPILIFIIMWIIFVIILATSFGIRNIQHRETIEIYEEYYELDKEMDLVYRMWRDWYQQYDEEEYYFKYRPEKYLRYLELKKIIGEFEK